MRTKKGLHTMGGVYDAGYRGEYNVQLVNLSKEPYRVEVGDKIAQLVIVPVTIATLVEADTLSESVRGEGRFGSTELRESKDTQSGLEIRESYCYRKRVWE